MNKKEKIAFLLDKLLIGRALYSLSNWFYGRHIRVVNLHSTGPELMENFEKQLQFYLRHYIPVTYEDVEQFFATGCWDKPKPGIILSFDDGMRENFDYAVPLLEKYNIKGWFFIPSGIIDASSDEQMELIGKKDGRYKLTYEDGRYFMTWDEIKYLCKNHVVGCHTYTHHRININDTDKLLEKEIRESKHLMEHKTGNDITIYCWVGGEENTYTKAAAKKIKDAGYKYSFMTNSYPLKSGQNPLQIQRSNIEAKYPAYLMRFQLSALMDFFFSAKRKRVCLLTNV